MNPNQLKNLCNTSCKDVLSTDVSLFQRSLTTESTQWIRQVESKAKTLKTGKIRLIAILSD